MSKAPQEIDVNFEIGSKGNYVMFELQSSDGKPLSPQAILDAISDVLLMEYNVEDVTLRDKGALS